MAERNASAQWGSRRTRQRQAVHAIFESEWQSFRTRQKGELELTTALHVCGRPGHYTIAVKVIDIFGNDSMTLMTVTAG